MTSKARNSFCGSQSYSIYNLTLYSKFSLSYDKTVERIIFLLNNLKISHYNDVHLCFKLKIKIQRCFSFLMIPFFH